MRPAELGPSILCRLRLQEISDVGIDLEGWKSPVDRDVVTRCRGGGLMGVFNFADLLRTYRHRSAYYACSTRTCMDLSIGIDNLPLSTKVRLWMRGLCFNPLLSVPGH